MLSEERRNSYDIAMMYDVQLSETMSRVVPPSERVYWDLTRRFSTKCGRLYGYVYHRNRFL
jgi:hypothetical protein